MRPLPALALLALSLPAAIAAVAATAGAQVPLPPHAAIYNGYSRGYQLTAAVAFTIVQLELPLDARQPGDTAGFVVRVNGAIALRSVGNASPAIATSIAVAAGDVVDVVGNWSPAATGSTTAHNSYGNAAPWPTTIEGVPHVLLRSGWQWDVGDAGFANGIPLQPTSGQIGRVRMHTAPAGTPATSTTLGAGCGEVTCNSLYGWYADAATAAAALAGNTVVLTPTATGYVASWIAGAAAYVTPGSGAVALATGDDGDVPWRLGGGALSTPYGPRATLRIGGNGVIAFGGSPIDTPGTSAWQPSPAGFLDAAQGGVYAWHDFDCTEPGSGPVLAEEQAGVLLVTFDGVESRSVPPAANPAKLQFQLDLASGVITIVLAAVDGDGTSPRGSAWLVGVSAPGPSQDCGPVALAAGPWTCADPETRALELAAISRPLVGTQWLLALEHVPPTAVFGIDVFGTTDPGLDDLTVLGMPGCGLRASPDVLHGWVPAGATHGYALAVPIGGALLGFDVFTTSAVLQVPAVNASGAITANGVRGRVGDV